MVAWSSREGWRGGLPGLSAPTLPTWATLPKLFLQVQSNWFLLAVMGGNSQLKLGFKKKKNWMG
jgi:hypothetical protein